ncbi:TetR family transcriptional regulator [Saccharopolyspora erythraea NRRL 2338]|uniref:Possible transcriptional regulator, TetR family n=2 Tax=Saccharopolyspora erythraea TaxID=1836 RepID=A4F7G7_SACEN|nr:TetR/AcrR family transcriptional regulator [Saccharopolyspora erythraea]EQD84800.1 TetR family transcriptional regulator [Saccharopolyspora erythraea D]PFG93793.1 TetR family transcriptional regulator [Saccharopolyspora erythraea NRRL 2338]QRK90629.1 TetR/AcrR family transcriptional regulator [Saccharopolyspora erythraea]CAL99991.1 possible transcriptional regulator, TetR family [Saccharopolyspora erythraea NRRL 2338]
MTTSDRSLAGGPRPRQAGTRQVSARRAELLDRLRDLFLAEGFAHLTLDDLAGRLHCSKSTLYTLAGSKEQLAVRVVGHYFKTATAFVEGRVETVTDVRDRMRVYLDAAAEALRPASREFIEDMAANSATRATYEANAHAAADRVRRYIRDGVREGVFREVHAALVAEMVGRTINGIQSGEIGERTGLSDAEAFAALSQFLLGGLSAEQGDNGRDHSSEEK